MADDPEKMEGEAGAALDARYSIEIAPESIPRLCEEYGLAFPVEG